MPLTNEEFARLDEARIKSLHLRSKQQKRILQLAFEHIEALSRQQVKALKLIELLTDQKRKSLCYRVPQFFYYVAAMTKYQLWTRWIRK